MKKFLKIVLIIIGVFFAIGIIGAIFGESSESQVEATPASSAKTEKMPEPKEETASNWKYSEQKDKMTDKAIYFAQCTSLNQLNFDFPYDGGSTLTILVRKSDGKNEVILQLSKGQFNSPYNSRVSIKFDDNGILKYEYSSAADGSSNYIFLSSANQIIQKLKTARLVKIEAPYFQGGRQVAEFNVEGLDWNH